DALAGKPFNDLGIEAIMKDAYIFVGMFEKLLKGGISFEGTPAVSASVKRLASQREAVIGAFQDQEAIKAAIARAEIREGFTAEETGQIVAATDVLRTNGLSAVSKDAQTSVKGLIDSVYKGFLGANSQNGVPAEVVSELAVDIHNNYVNGQRGPGFIVYDQALQDALYGAIQAEIAATGNPNLTHKKFKAEKKNFLTLDGFLDPNQKWQIGLENFTSDAAKDILRAAGIKDGQVINTVNNDWNALVSLKVAGTQWSQAKRMAYLADLQNTAIKEVLTVLNDTGLVEALVSALERGDRQAAADAVVQILRVINLVWRLGNDWDALAGKPFNDLGIEAIMK
ncbi:MAG: hypothetical protein WCK93_13620, partial [Nitrosomonadales bacterium]